MPRKPIPPLVDSTSSPTAPIIHGHARDPRMAIESQRSDKALGLPMLPDVSGTAEGTDVTPMRHKCHKCHKCHQSDRCLAKLRVWNPGAVLPRMGRNSVRTHRSPAWHKILDLWKTPTTLKVTHKHCLCHQYIGHMPWWSTESGSTHRAPHQSIVLNLFAKSLPAPTIAGLLPIRCFPSSSRSGHSGPGNLQSTASCRHSWWVPPVLPQLHQELCDHKQSSSCDTHWWRNATQQQGMASCAMAWHERRALLGYLPKSVWNQQNMVIMVRKSISLLIARKLVAHRTKGGEILSRPVLLRFIVDHGRYVLKGGPVVSLLSHLRLLDFFGMPTRPQV